MAILKNDRVQLVTVKQTVPNNLNGTGTIQTVGKQVIGSGTTFATQLQPGGWIVDLTQNECHKIVQIQDNTNLFIDAAFTADIAAGTALVYIPRFFYKEISTSSTGSYIVDGVTLPAGTSIDWSKSSNRNTGGNDFVDPIVIDPNGNEVIVTYIRY